jgi:hypothetical protein
MASIELLERLRGGYRERVEVFEREPPRELVAPDDIVRVDGLGRNVVACPAGQSPPHWLQLTSKERDGLVEPPQPPPDGTLEPGHAGFTPRNTVVGYIIDTVD